MNKNKSQETIDDIRKKVRLEEYGVENVLTINLKKKYSLFIYLIQTQETDYPGTYSEYDDSWNFEDFKKVI